MTRVPRARGVRFQLTAALLLFTGCRESPTQQAPPPPLVRVARAEPGPVTQFFYYNGSVRAIEEVEIRARVSGQVEQIAFEPSTNVSRGDLLFVIEPARYRAAVARAEGELERARAQLALTDITRKRVERAYEQQAASEDELSTARAEHSERLAAVQTAEANLADAEIDLSYTEVRAPLAGRVDEAKVDVGDLVGHNEPTLLCTVVQMKPIHAYFDVSERIALQYLARGQDGTIDERTPPAFLGLANETGYPHRGIIDYVDNVLDNTTGTLTVRARFSNERHLLYPGLYARIRVPFEEITDAVLVHENAVATGLDGKYVLAVDEQNVVQRRSVTLGEPTDDGRVQIVTGLESGQQYIVEGLQKARPGMPVRIETASTRPAVDSAATQPSTRRVQR